MAEFVIKGVAYQSRMLDGEIQMLVMKRLLPTFTALVGCRPLLDGAQTGRTPQAGEATEADEGSPEPLSIQDLLMPVAREMAAIKDDDVRFVTNACLDVTQRQVKTGSGWAGVRQRGIIQDRDDAKLTTRLTICWHVLMENAIEVGEVFGLDVSSFAGLSLPLG